MRCGAMDRRSQNITRVGLSSLQPSAEDFKRFIQNNCALGEVRMKIHEYQGKEILKNLVLLCRAVFRA